MSELNKGTIPEEFAIKFESYHVPAMPTGHYSISSTLDVIKNVPTKLDEASIDLFVGGPRFYLAPDEIHAVFPPANSNGDFDNVLPHIELNRSTLPWERSTGSNDNKLPWFALVLIEEDELADTEKVIGVSRKPWSKGGNQGLRSDFLLLEEPGDEPVKMDNSDKTPAPFPPAKVINFNRKFLKSILPNEADLKLLCHLRLGTDQQGQKYERALMVCNRIPRAGRKAEVHLVSLEQYHGLRKAQVSEPTVELISLHSWSFSCPNEEEYRLSEINLKRIQDKTLKSKLLNMIEPGVAREQMYRGKNSFISSLKETGLFNKPNDVKNKSALMDVLKACRIETETFKGLIDSLDKGLMRVPNNKESTSDGAEFFNLGAIPMAHGLRQGGKSVSWYHGPLLSTTLDYQNLALPVRNSDELLIYEQLTGMLDVSYAAAWELGRLLVLGDQKISQQISQWKTSHAREVAQVEDQLVFSHIPFMDSDFVHRKDGPLDASLQKYFTDLALLKGLPFQYLVPHKSYTPMESLRFFKVDPVWLEALLDGAFSIGRVTKLDTKREIHAQAPPHQPKRPAMSGILLRSDLVSGWPSIQVDGYKKPSGKQALSEANRAKNLLPIVRFEKLSSDFLIVIFAGDLKELDIHLPPQSLHFGFNRAESLADNPLKKTTFFKELKSLKDGTEQRGVVQKIEWHDKDLLIFNPSEFVKQMTKETLKAISHTGNLFQSNHLAVELIEGVPRLRVTLL